MIELIYRNICFSQVGCRGCKAKNESKHPAIGAKFDECCLIKQFCLFDLIGKEMICENCRCFSKESARCKLLEDTWYGEKPIKELKYYGYWKVNLYE